jgi:hypothetical protein
MNLNKSFASLVTLAMLSLPASAWSQTPPPAPAAAPVAVPTSDGFELKDLAHGFVFTAPNSAWSINASQYAVSLTHGTYYDAYITIKKSWYTVATVQEAYDKRKDNLKSYLPGAEYLRDAEAITVGAEAALSMTYKDPAQQKISREIVFLHKGVPYELSFTVKEENFPKVKDDFAAILRAIQTI